MVEVSAVVPAAPPVVWERLAAKFAELYPPSPHAPKLELDREGLRLAAQGGWWYRGEYAVEAHPDGSRVTHRVRNVAKRGRWAVPLANRLFIGFREQTETGFGDLMTAVTRAL